MIGEGGEDFNLPPPSTQYKRLASKVVDHSPSFVLWPPSLKVVN